MPARHHRHRPFLEHLENRDLLAASLTGNLTSGILTIEGTEAADRITVRQINGRISVDGINLRVGNTNQKDVAATSISRIRVYGLGGNDMISLNSESIPGQQPITISAFVYGGDGHDTIRGGWGNDWLYGGNGSDAIYGNKGNDIIQGEAGSDVLYGDDGNDRIWGQAGNDYLYGGAGDDDLYGGEGNDYHDGGAGADLFVRDLGFDSYRDEFDLSRMFVNGAAPADIIQQDAPTCAMLAPLAEMAQNGYNLASQVTYAGNGLFDVKLFQNGKWETQRVAFNGTWNDNDPAPSRDAQGRTTSEFWTIIFQRARLQMYGINYRVAMTSADWAAHNTLTKGLLQDPGEALYNFTGKVPEYHYANLVNPLTLYNADQAKRLIVVTTPGSGTNTTLDPNSGVIAWHAYAVTRVYQSSGQWMLDLYNPWAKDGNGTPRDGKNDGFLTVTFTEFQSYFRSARIV